MITWIRVLFAQGWGFGLDIELTEDEVLGELDPGLTARAPERDLVAA